jgi:hypothetical protein
MRAIPTSVWSHSSTDRKSKCSTLDVRISKPPEVHSYPDLVNRIAVVAYHNPEHVLFFRGQTKTYLKRLSGGRQGDSIYPTIYRSPGESLSQAELVSRFDRLDQNAKVLCQEFKSADLLGHDKITKFQELTWAILQHHEVCPTPLLDVTSSLRVAASFALDNSKEGYLYAFGFPHPNGSITYSSDHKLLNVRLLSICPPQARRPYFQEGFLVGTFQSRRLQKHSSLDVGVRLIAKFKLLDSPFWSRKFPAIPRTALYPTDDKIWHLCAILKGRRKTEGPEP